MIRVHAVGEQQLLAAQVMTSFGSTVTNTASMSWSVFGSLAFKTQRFCSLLRENAQAHGLLPPVPPAPRLERLRIARPLCIQIERRKSGLPFV